MRLFRTLIFVLVCACLIWLAVLLFVKIFAGGTDTGSRATTNLGSYARVGTEAIFTIDGPVKLSQDHRTLRISVDNSEVNMELYSDYAGSVIQQATFPNTSEGYEVFLRSLDTLGFNRGDDKITKDERGQCPLQNRYVYQLTDNGQDVFRYWSTSCGPGSSKSQRGPVQTLFQRQVPSQTLDEFLNNM